MISLYSHASQAIVGARAEQEDACAFAVAKAPSGRRGPDTVTTAGRTCQQFLAILADGMGGHVAGARASAIACETFAQSYERAGGTIQQRLASALEDANARIRDEVAASPELDGMGCTLIGASFDETALRWVSVGDSLLYLFRDNKLYQLNEDHSLAPVLDELVQSGEMSPSEALTHPRRHFLRSALTGGKIDMIDLNGDGLELEPDDWVLIASDGIETLSHSDIADVVASHRNDPPSALVENLLKAVEANHNPHQDNATVMAVRPRFSGD